MRDLDYTLDVELLDAAQALGAEALNEGIRPAPYHPAGALHFDATAGIITYGPGNDDLDELGAPAPGAPRTPAEALAAGRVFSAEDVYVGVGYCLKTIRTLYGVAPLWPDAQTAWENAKQRHHTADPTAIPRGVPVWWTNSGFGHVALSVGGGFCLTTDYRRSGFLDLAPIAPLAAWCGGRLAGWSETINGVDVWDQRPAPSFDLEDRIVTVRAAIRRAKANDAGEWRIKGLERWRDQLIERQET